MSRAWQREALIFRPLVSREETRARFHRITDEVLTIEGTDGNITIFRSGGVFHHIAPEFKELDLPGVSTGASDVAVYEALSGCTDEEAFDSFGARNWLLLTQAQITKFCKRFTQHLAPTGSGPTSFLFREKEKYYSASVQIWNGEIGVNFFPLGGGVVHPKGFRVVVPGVIVHSLRK